MEKRFRTLDLKSSYETGQEEFIRGFYIPVLRASLSYDRIAGFFSSSSLEAAAFGMAGLIRNHGKMRLITCPRLDEDDIKLFYEVASNPEQFREEKLHFLSKDLPYVFQKNHTRALGWMLVNGYLTIKFALVNTATKTGILKDAEQIGILHQKVGIFTDETGDKISFSGSVNETISGWKYNIEEFKVFRSWNEERKYLESDEEKFQAFWNNRRDYVSVYSLSEAVQKNLMQGSKSCSIEVLSRKKERKDVQKNEMLEALNLFFYQKDAVQKWKENHYFLLFQMATGTGKTRTALGCMAELMVLHQKLIVIVACPQGTLSLQWKREIENSPLNFEMKSVIDGTNKRWKSDLKEAVLRVATGFYHAIIIFTTHTTSAKKEFKDIINESTETIKYLFVGDEAHGLGASVTRKALLDRYDYRIGLSATPSRWFDESGTKLLEAYFGNELYEFSINDALTTIHPLTGKTFLVPYTYHLEFIDLTEQELEEYSKISRHIKKLGKYGKNSEEYGKQLEYLLFKRADTVKAAQNKYKKLREILQSIDNIHDLIIFVSSEQMKPVLEILYEMKIPSQSFTKETGTVIKDQYGGQTERQFVIDHFKKGYFKVLVAIKCLDEGIDIPSAQNAILMASSTNPREYIQRIGRVIRQSPGKQEARIWDLTIRPCANQFNNPELKEFEKMICAKEKVRIFDIVKNAKNNAEALKVLYDEMGDD